MPYITPARRAELDPFIANLAKEITDAGELNYCLTRIALSVLEGREGTARYQDYSAVGGVLQDVRDEYYRRVMAPHEDKAILKNGDVYPVPLAALDIDGELKIRRISPAPDKKSCELCDGKGLHTVNGPTPCPRCGAAYVPDKILPTGACPDCHGNPCVCDMGAHAT